MRLQLAAAVVASLAFASRGEAQPAGDSAATSTVGVYSDDDATTVTTTLLDGDVAVTDEVVVGAHALFDAVSSASVDVVSAATERFEETRVETGGRVGAIAPGAIELGLAVVHSRENDWSSTGVSLSLAREFAQKNTRLTASLGGVDNAVGRAGDPVFHERQTSHTVELGVTQLLDRRTLATASYTRQVVAGWQSSPYRYVTIANGRFSALESHPRARTRHAVSVRVARSVGDASAVDADYRVYRDDWGILSHTLQGSLRYAPGKAWDVRVRARYYIQGAAHFWRMRYDAPMTYMSADRELSTFWNASAGAKVARQFGGLVASARCDVIHYRFVEFALLEQRRAVVASGSVSYQW